MSDTESDYSDDSAPNAEDLKMQKLLMEWDDKDAQKEEYVDSDDSDEENDEEFAKKAALLRASSFSDEEDSDEEEDAVPAPAVVEESDSEEEDVSEAEEEAPIILQAAPVTVAESDSEEEESEAEEEAPIILQAAPVTVAESDSEEEESMAEKEKSEVEDVDASDEEVAGDESEAGEESDEEEEEEEEEVKEEAVVKKSKKERKKERKDKKKEKKSRSKSKKVVDDSDDDGDTKSVDTEIHESDDDGEEVVDELKKKPKKKKEKSKPKKITEITEEDNEDDIEMKNLLATWDADNGAEDEDDDDDDSDEESEASEREVILDDNVIDHIVLAAPDLDEAIEDFEKKTGLTPIIAGTIKGLGIKCARVSFSDATYLEIIAPDPKGPGPIGELLKNRGITELTPFHYAIRSKRAEQLKDEVSKFGYVPDHITMFGAKPDGTPRKWEMLYLYGHKLGGVCPFFINWANSDHPCATLPVVGSLKKFKIRAPAEDPVHKLFEHIRVEGIEIEEGKAKMSFSFKSPEGTIKFESKSPVGFKFPGFETDVGAIPGDDGSQDAVVVFENPTLPELLSISDDEYDMLPPPAV